MIGRRPASEEFYQFVTNTYSMESKDLILKFFITFSRFEYALKESGTFRKVTSKAEPDWNKFTRSLAKEWATGLLRPVQNAVNYILEEPPRIQFVVDTSVVWQERPFPPNTAEINRISQHIRDIRNNLFHGGKDMGIASVELSRNHKLLQSALVILNEWLRLSPDVSRLFLREI